MKTGTGVLSFLELKYGEISFKREFLSTLPTEIINTIFEKYSRDDHWLDIDDADIKRKITFLTNLSNTQTACWMLRRELVKYERSLHE